MDAIVNHILQAKPAELDQLRKFLDGHLNTMRAHQAMLGNALGVLEPAKHTLGMCYLLFVRASVGHQVDAHFAAQCEPLLDGFAPGQVWDACPDRFAFIVHRYAETLRRLGQPQRGLLRLRRVAAALAPTPDFLTPAHADFLLLCLCAKNYAAARPMLEQPIFEIDPHRTGLTPRDYLLYYYYGSMVWIGLKRWDRAYEFSLSAITIPYQNAVSAVTAEAFKKFVVAALITKGKLEGVPKQAPGVLKKYAPEYMEFAAAYSKGEVAKMNELMTTYREVFSQDRNLGIVEQALAHYTHQAVQRLTSTYLTLSLADIAAHVRLPSPQHAEAILLQMIQAGELEARIDQRNGMVSFSDVADPSQLLQSIDGEIAASQRIIARLESMDEEIQASRDYLTKQVLRDPHLRDELEQVMKGGSMKGKVRGIFESLLKG